jgi:hypothetical protein
MNEFNRLIKVRNSIIHLKPVMVNNFNEQQLMSASAKVENQSVERRKIAKQAPSIFINLVTELTKVDESEELANLITGMGLPIPGFKRDFIETAHNK